MSEHPAEASPPETSSNGSLDELLGEEVSPVVVAQVEEAMVVKRAPPKGYVAFFITRALIWLFIGQVGALTLAYVGIVLGAALAGVTNLKEATDALLEAITVIVPVTTTLLGVVIGYYFREREEAYTEEAEV